MIKDVKELKKDALIASEDYRNIVKSYESEILRGISTLCILIIINQSEGASSYGYQILKDLESKTDKTFIVEEGTLYPILKKLEREGILTSEKKPSGGRLRKYYKFTEDGRKILNHLTGFFTKLIESITSLLEITISLQDRFLYCRNCTNRIDLGQKDLKFCAVCGLNIEDLIHEVQKK